MKSPLLRIFPVFCWSLILVAKSGAVSGEVSLVAPGGPANESKTQEIVASGIGKDASSAEKQALIAAVQQAVGMYLDTKTVIENEKLINDRILSLSNGFVSEYKVISGPQQRTDGLFTITINARVQGGQVVGALKESNIIKGELAGKNLYAKNMTQMMNSEDARQMLEEKLPELLINGIKLEFVDSNGNPRTSLAPIDTQRISERVDKSKERSFVDARVEPRLEVQQKVKCTWYVKSYMDRAFYSVTIYPTLKRCLDVIYGDSCREAEFQNLDAETMAASPNDARNERLNKISLHASTVGLFGPSNNSWSHGQRNIFLLRTAARNGESCTGTIYFGEKYLLKISGKSKDWNHPYKPNADRPRFTKNGVIIDPFKAYDIDQTIQLKALSKSGDLIAFGEANIPDPLNPIRQIIAPCSGFETLDTGLFKSIVFIPYVVSKISIDIALDDLKEVGRLEAVLKPTKVEFEIVPAQRFQ
jgi:hypothetical protein